MITYNGTVTFKNGRSFQVDTSVRSNLELPEAILIAAIHSIMKDEKTINKREAVYEAAIMLNYNEKTVRRVIDRLYP